MTTPTPPKRVIERVLSNADRDANGCLVSRYSLGSHGYAQIGWYTNGVQSMTLAHRVAWIAANGPIPDGLTVDHICKNRRCVEVSHLRLLTNFENARRTSGRDWPLGQCINGHPNSMIVNRPSGRVCGACDSAWKQSHAARRRAA